MLKVYTRNKTIIPGKEAFDAAMTQLSESKKELMIAGSERDALMIQLQGTQFF